MPSSCHLARCLLITSLAISLAACSQDTAADGDSWMLGEPTRDAGSARLDEGSPSYRWNYPELNGRMKEAVMGCVNDFPTLGDSEVVDVRDLRGVVWAWGISPGGAMSWYDNACVRQME